MLSKNDIKNLERKYGFFPQKKLGQNFLIDANVKDKLLKFAAFEENDILVEIGSGLGQLTFDLSRVAKKVVAIEFDKKLFSALSDSAKDFSNIVLVHEDFLKFDLKDFVPKNRKIKVISNLPYYVSSPVILKLFAHSECIDSAILTLQKEVADRLIAEPRTKDYGSFTLFAEFHSEIKKLFNISRKSFYPSPKVDSTVILMKMRAEPPVKVDDKRNLFSLIRAGFSTRRKTLLNAALLQNYKGLTKERLAGLLKAAGIPAGARAETLRLSDFARIVNSIT